MTSPLRLAQSTIVHHSTAAIAPHGLHKPVIDLPLSRFGNPAPASATPRDDRAAILQGARAADFVAKIAFRTSRVDSLRIGAGSDEPEDDGSDCQFDGLNGHRKTYLGCTIDLTENC
jgi:hypothetical protein